MISKAALKRAAYTASGMLAWKWANLPDGIYCFNYHRIGDATTAEFDPDLYSCDASTFEEHVLLLQKHFQLINIDQLVALLDSGVEPDRRYALITFDDGYLDSFEVAYPVLQRLGESGVFFIPVDYSGSRIIPWWDEIAWHVRHFRGDAIRLAHWREPIHVNQRDPSRSVREVIKAFKSDNAADMEDKLTQLRMLTGLDCQHDSDIQLFASPAQIREMAENGMDIGAHSRSHQILSHLDDAAQDREIRESKTRLEAITGRPVAAFAYPVGGADAFTARTEQLVEEAGYQVAFSFIQGINTSLAGRRFHLSRLGVDSNISPHGLRIQIVRAARH